MSASLECRLNGGFFPICALAHMEVDNLIHSLFSRDYRDSWSEQEELDNDRIDFERAEYCVAVGQSLVVYGGAYQFYTFSVYENFLDLSEIKKTSLPKLPCEGWLDVNSTAMCVIRNRYVLITGGKNRSSSEAKGDGFLLDVDSGEWIVEPAQPKLVQVRFWQASCATF